MLTSKARNLQLDKGIYKVYMYCRRSQLKSKNQNRKMVFMAECIPGGTK